MAIKSDKNKENMEILHIGGIADKGTTNLPESVIASRHSFRLESDVSTDGLHHHDYERHDFLVEQEYPTPLLKVQVMVHTGMVESVACVLVGAHFGGSAIIDSDETK